MFLYQLARKANRRIKDERKRRMGAFLSPVRRIERVAPVSGERICAMTFDDGPANVPASPDVAQGRALTRHLCDVLTAYDCAATFDVVGDTSENYPDKRGKPDTAYWGGRRFDHYPDIGMDKSGGAVNCPELVEHLLHSGMELSNHGYRHILCGPMRAVYGRREFFKNIGEVVSDLKRLHDYIENTFSYKMQLARPPHYIDGIPGGFSTFDAYTIMGYNYMAASFDGGGWLPTKNGYESDVEAMTGLISRALERDPDCLNGQIIFQKDGCNMSRLTPIASALEPQLKLLRAHGYRVVPVSDLLKRSPFEDIGDKDACFEAARALTQRGCVTGYKNNTFQPERKLIFGELCAMLCPRDEHTRRLLLRIDGQSAEAGHTLSHPYATAIQWAWSNGVFAQINDPVDAGMLESVMKIAGLSGRASHDGFYNRAQAVMDIYRSIPQDGAPFRHGDARE